VLIEKPARGDFLSIVEGGFGLQYSPLLAYREGQGLVLFCQMDLTGRTEMDPAATQLTRNIIRYVSAWKAPPSRKAVYVGEAAGKTHLESAGLKLGSFSKEELAADRLLIVGPGSGEKLAGEAEAIKNWLKGGGYLLALGLDGAEARTFLPGKITMKKQEYISSFFEPLGMNSLLQGIGPGHVHNRDPRQIPLVTKGATMIGNGILAKATDANIVYCQLVPWQFDNSKQMNLRRTFRRASCLVTRLAANMGASGSTPVLARFKPSGGGIRETLAGGSLPGCAAGMGRSLSFLPW
jgi:hypothetical protein